VHCVKQEQVRVTSDEELHHFGGGLGGYWNVASRAFQRCRDSSKAITPGTSLRIVSRARVTERGGGGSDNKAQKRKRKRESGVRLTLTEHPSLPCTLTVSVTSEEAMLDHGGSLSAHRLW
jgi:hypothetical protein